MSEPTESNEGTAIDNAVSVAEGGLFNTAEETVETTEVVAETTETEAEATKDEKAEDEKPAEEEKKEEEKPEEDKKETKSEEDPKFASRFAALSRKEKQVRQAQEDLKKQQATIKQLQEKYKKFEKIEELMSKNELFEAAEELGLKPEEIVSKVMASEKEKVEKETIDYKVSELQKIVEDLKKDNEALRLEKQQEQINSRISSFKHDIEKEIQKNADKYEIVATQNLVDDVFETIKEYHKKTGEVLAIDEAIKHVEEYYEEEFNNKWGKIKKFNKVTPKEEPKAPVAETKPPVVEKTESKKAVSKTLTNADVASTNDKSTDDLDEDERLELAAKFWKQG